MCGETFSYLTPQYVLKDSNKRFYRTNEGAFWDYYGYQYFLHLDDAWVLERETQAITRLFNHIRNWDAEHGDRHPVIAAQIHNEPDIFMRWRLADYKVSYRNGMELTKPAAWVMTLNALDAVGKAVQQSPYKVLTRVNLTSSDGGIGRFRNTPQAGQRMCSTFRVSTSYPLTPIRSISATLEMKSWPMPRYRAITRLWLRTKARMRTPRVFCSLRLPQAEVTISTT